MQNENQTTAEQLAHAETQVKVWTDKNFFAEYSDGQYYVSGRRASDLSNIAHWKAEVARLKQGAA